ncbi:hypothetical protein F7725_005364, partial [Dissostichus mawsoni]
MYLEIQGKVLYSQVQLCWWLTTKAGIHCDRVTLALKYTKSSPRCTVSEKKRGARSMQKAKIDSKLEKAVTITELLFNKILEKVEGADFKVTSEDLNHLDKA